MLGNLSDRAVEPGGLVRRHEHYFAEHSALHVLAHDLAAVRHHHNGEFVAVLPSLELTEFVEEDNYHHHHHRGHLRQPEWESESVLALFK